MSESLRLRLPFILTNQSQKEVTHNEALTNLDLLAHAAAISSLTAPPADPLPGDCYLVGSPASGLWAGFEDHLALWLGNAWRFQSPFDGLRARVRDQSLDALYENGAWSFGIVTAARVEIGGVQVLAARQAGIGGPTGGAVVDVEARSAIDAMLAALRTHGLIESA